jgi:hypothetical protein
MNYYLLYLDPGSGSYLLQAIIAAVLGGLMFFKNIWLSVKSFFFKRKTKEGLKQQEPAEKKNI